MFLSLKIGFTFANAVNVYADLAKISVLDPSSLMIAPMYLNYFAVSPSSCQLAVMCDLIVLLLFVIILFFFCANFPSISG